MSRKYNFAPGPSALPLEVLEKAQSELLNYEDCGCSVLEMSHRSKEFKDIVSEAETLLRELLSVPDNYKILFMHGGASGQFAALPLNLYKNGKADYAVTGLFSKKAAAQAKSYLDVSIIKSGEDTNFSLIPEIKKSDINPESDYLHICFNNTVYGTKYPFIPETGDVPLIADMSSCILSEEVDVSKFGAIYFGVQKNVAPAGLSVIIIRDDLLGYAKKETPDILNYQKMSESSSLYNTPNCFGIYMAMLNFRWIKSLGGVKEMERRSKEKAELIYNYLDNQNFYIPLADKANRSMMNVTFKTKDSETDEKFVKFALERNLMSLKGHRSIGGMRASIYNAMPIEGVKALIEVMEEFRESEEK